MLSDDQDLRMRVIRMAFDFCYWQSRFPELLDSVEALAKDNDPYDWELVKHCRGNDIARCQYARFAETVDAQHNNGWGEAPNKRDLWRRTEKY